MTSYVAIDQPIGEWNGNSLARMGFSADEVESERGRRPRVALAQGSADPQRIECAPI